MPQRHFFSGIFFCLVLASCSHQPVDSYDQRKSAKISDEKLWQDRTKNDLELIRKTIEESHPAWPVSSDPEPQKLLEEGYQAALERLSSVKGFTGYYAVLRGFINTFGDPHFQVQPESIEAVRQIPYRWPGFVVAKRMKEFEIVLREEELLDELHYGAKLRNCDGKSVELLLKENIYPFFGNPTIKSHETSWGSRLLFDFGNPFVQLPKKCTFYTVRGTKEFELEWKSIDLVKAFPLVMRASYGGRPNAGLNETLEGLHILSLPTFDPDQRTQNVYQEILQNKMKPSPAETLVFDLRGNSGGDASWIKEFTLLTMGDVIYKQLETSYSKKYPETFRYRVSQSNLDALRKMRDQQIQAIGVAEYFSPLVEKMTKSLANKEKFLDVEADVKSEPAPKSVKLPWKHVYVVTDGVCTRACLRFLDLLFEASNVTHIGLPTDADSVYLQTAPLILSGGYLKLSYPMMQVLNRKRKNFQAYAPKYYFEGDPANQNLWLRFIAEIHNRKR